MPKHFRWRKAKPAKEQPLADPNQNTRDQNKREISGDIHVRGEVETKFPPDIAEQHKTDRKEDKADAKKRYVVELLTLAAVVIYAGIAGWQGCETKTIIALTQKHFQIDQRPYVKISDIEFIEPPMVGKPVRINVVLKNVGKGQAQNVFILRHLLFRPQESQFRVDPANIDDGKLGRVIDIGDSVTTTATSVRDTYAVGESYEINPADIVPWDGTEIVLFGRVAYEDRFGNKYCYPFMMQKANGSMWAAMMGMHIENPDHIVYWNELCPKELIKEAK